MTDDLSRVPEPEEHSEPTVPTAMLEGFRSTQLSQSSWPD